MKVTVAIDSFKECASSIELANAIKKGITPFVEELQLVPISDGGEGAIDTIAAHFSGTFQQVETINPYGEIIEEHYFLTTIDGVETAVIESARFVGIHFSNGRKEDSYLGSSFGLGVVLLDAVKRGVKQLILTLGGSGTTDGGLGMLQALGAKITNDTGHLLTKTTNPLLDAAHLEIEAVQQKLADVTLIVANDVDNPYAGKNGAACIFGPQKGLTAEQITLLDNQLTQIAKEMVVKKYPDLRVVAGAGAAGGLGGALALLGATMKAGFPLFADLIQLEKHLSDSDWVITGEGRLDMQSSAGKVPYGVAQLAQKHKTKTLLLCGSYEEIPEQTLFNGIFAIQREAVSLKQAMNKEYALKNIEMVSHELFQFLHAGLN